MDKEPMSTEEQYVLQAETQVLGCLLVDNGTAPAITQTLIPEHFGNAAHQEIYAAALAVLKKEQVPSTITVMEELKERNKLDMVGGLFYLTRLRDGLVTKAQLDGHMAIIKKYALKRKLNRLGMELQCKSNDATENPEKLLSDTEATLQQLKEQQAVNVPGTGEHLQAYMEDRYAMYTDPEAHLGLTTGFDSLDKILLGLRPGNVIYLGARPSMGKTALALNIALAACRNEGRTKKHTLFVSVEMTAMEIVNRLCSAITSIDSKLLDKPQNLSKGEWSALYHAIDTINESGLELVEASYCSLVKLTQLCYTAKQKYGLDFVVIDYLGLLQGTPKQDIYAETGEISHYLKCLAKELNVPILALCQLNRKVEDRANKQPNLADLRNSGNLEQDADVVLMLYRDDFYNPHTSKEPNIAIVKVEKNRHGQQGEVKLFFDKPHNRFLEVCA